MKRKITKNDKRGKVKYVMKVKKVFSNVMKRAPRKKQIKSNKSVKKLNIENSIYTLRNNKVIEKKQLIRETQPKLKRVPRKSKEQNDNNDIKNERNSLVKTAKSKTEKKRKTKPSINVSFIEESIDKSHNNRAFKSSLSSPSRTYVDIATKLKVLDIYNRSLSFTETSRLTGIKYQTIRYWKMREDLILQKARKQECLDKPSPHFSKEVFPSMSESKISRKESLKKSPIVMTSSSPDSPNKCHVNKSSTNKKVSIEAEDTEVTTAVKGTRTRKSSKTVVNGTLPNFPSLQAIVDEINRLSFIYESPDCLESLSAHFKILLSGHGADKSFDNTLLLAKTKLQDETFRHIISDFFQGEYKLLKEINHQFNQINQKRTKNLKKNLEELRNYFYGSIQRLQVLKKQLI